MFDNTFEDGSRELDSRLTSYTRELKTKGVREVYTTQEELDKFIDGLLPLVREYGIMHGTSAAIKMAGRVLLSDREFGIFPALVFQIGYVGFSQLEAVVHQLTKLANSRLYPLNYLKSLDSLNQVLIESLSLSDFTVQHDSLDVNQLTIIDNVTKRTVAQYDLEIGVDAASIADLQEFWFNYKPYDLAHLPVVSKQFANVPLNWTLDALFSGFLADRLETNKICSFAVLEDCHVTIEAFQHSGFNLVGRGLNTSLMEFDSDKYREVMSEHGAF